MKAYSVPRPMVLLSLTKDQWRSSSNWFPSYLLFLHAHSSLENYHLRLLPASYLPFYLPCSDCSLPMALLFFTEPAGLREIQDFLGRIQFYQYLGKHQNLVRLEGCCTERLPLYMVLEDMAQGDLLSFLWTCRRVSSRVEMLRRRDLTWPN